MSHDIRNLLPKHLYFTTIQPHRETYFPGTRLPHRDVNYQTHLRKNFGNHDYSILTNTKLLPAHDQVPSRLPSGNHNHDAVPDSSSRLKSQISVGIKTQIDGSPFIRNAVKISIVADEIGRVICDSWEARPKDHCIQQNVNRYVPGMNNVLEFLHVRYKTSCLYNGKCVTRSALSSVVTIPGYDRLSSHPLI